MTMFLVDTDVLVDVQRGHQPAIAWLDAQTEVPSVPGLVVVELIQRARNKAEVRRALKLVKAMPIVWPTQADCFRALGDYSILHLSEGLGLIDALIAACAVGCSGTLYSFNAKHYKKIPGLLLAEPYSR